MATIDRAPVASSRRLPVSGAVLGDAFERPPDMVVIVRYQDDDWHRLDGEGCPRARGVLQRENYEQRDLDEDELSEFIANAPGNPCSDCRWPT